ncbi:hypothetical protein REPUB_Repub04eG0184800 [Reevesia pubescens]
MYSSLILYFPVDSYHSLEKNTKCQPDGVVALAKWRILNRLHDRNETLYYLVRLVCQNYSGLFRHPRGIYFSAKDKGQMMSMIYNWPAQQVDMIVLTDGSCILGLGGLVVQGIAILIGKLDMYVAATSINPQRVDDACAFNNLMTILIYVFGFISHFFCLSSGARLGVLSMVVQTIAKMIGQCETAAQNFFLLDKDGLITKERKNLDPAAAPFAKDQGQIVGLKRGGFFT